MSEALRKARRFEAARERTIPPEARPAFHLTPRTGWLNDPNGFSHYNGQYHLFYQYHPYSSQWGPMHWGHAVSDDLLTWRHLPCALAPDRPYDREGCFSGSAAVLPGGRHLLMYTGVTPASGGGQAEGFAPAKLLQVQNIAIGNGADYTKFEHNPVLTGADLPPGGSPCEFRDPKIIPAPDGGFRALIANEEEGAGGRILLYRSRDALHWAFERVLFRNGNRFGRMWECPDLFPLGGRAVLLVSAMEMLPEGFEYHSGNNTIYFTGRFDPETAEFTEETNHAADYGIDFYAGQTLEAPDGRRILVGWMQNPDTCNLRSDVAAPWFGQMTLPRELSLKDGVVFQKPVRELESHRASPVVRQNIIIEESPVILPELAGRLLDMEIEVEPADYGNPYQKFSCRFAQDEHFYTELYFRPREGLLKLDRKFSGSRKAIINQRRALIRHDRGRFKFRLILDRFSVEIFIGGGEKVMTAAIATEPSAGQVSFLADGSVRLHITKYDLRF